jgi:hypothetical protein
MIYGLYTLRQTTLRRPNTPGPTISVFKLQTIAKEKRKKKTSVYDWPNFQSKTAAIQVCSATFFCFKLILLINENFYKKKS